MPRDRKLPTITTPVDPAGVRRELVEAVIADMLARRGRGETLTDAAVIEAHASLQPELEAELRAMQAMHRMFLSARKAGPIADASGTPSAQMSVTRVLTSADGAESVRAVAIHGYAILHEISSGGQGTVFKATQDATGRAVAIKVIPGGLLTGSRHRARFDREAAILAKLDHPNIVGILDRGRTDDGSFFLVMPLIDGRTLDDHMQRWGRAFKPDVKEMLRLFVQIAQAMAEAHRQGIIHRDLKPANVRLDKRGRPHILDFGLARLQSDAGSVDHTRAITMTGQIVGSLPWTSPEQVLHKTGEVDARSDVYALGVMLYQGLTDAFPYSVLGSVREVLDNIARAVPAPPSETKVGGSRGVDGRLDAIVLRALAKSPAERYQSAQDLADDLERYLAGKPLVTLIKPVPRRYRRLLLLLVPVVLLGGAGVVAWNWDSPAHLQLDEVSNTVGMRLLRLPRGEVMMGSPAYEVGRDAGERQRRTRIERDFLMSATEVTQKQYAAVMGQLPAEQTDTGDEMPVHSVTWTEAVEFCRRLSEREKRQYRLPREAEWEYACRAAPHAMLPFAGTGQLESMGWYKGNSDGRLHGVGTKQPNGWGLYDMHGNVSEWCEDSYLPGGDPTGPDLPILPGGPLRLLRGGCFLSPDTQCRSAARLFRDPEARRRDIGFRIVAEM